jgi:hypothetical protein
MIELRPIDLINAHLISYMQYSWHVHDSRRALLFPMGKEKRTSARQRRKTQG